MFLSGLAGFSPVICEVSLDRQADREPHTRGIKLLHSLVQGCNREAHACGRDRPEPPSFHRYVHPQSIYLLVDRLALLQLVHLRSDGSASVVGNDPGADIQWRKSRPYISYELSAWWPQLYI